jgi:hypothetical protein
MEKVPYSQSQFKHKSADEILPEEDLKAGYVAFW